MHAKELLPLRLKKVPFRKVRHAEIPGPWVPASDTVQAEEVRALALPCTTSWMFFRAPFSGLEQITCHKASDTSPRPLDTEKRVRGFKPPSSWRAAIGSTLLKNSILSLIHWLWSCCGGSSRMSCKAGLLHLDKTGASITSPDTQAVLVVPCRRVGFVGPHLSSTDWETLSGRKELSRTGSSNAWCCTAS